MSRRYSYSTCLSFGTDGEKHDGLFRWEGVPEALQASIAQCDAAIARATTNQEEEG